MSEAERLTRRLKEMPTSELFYLMEQTQKIDDAVTELLIRYITDELQARKAS